MNRSAIMKVILLQDVARVGRKYEVKSVPDGHAHNYLIPKMLALPATPQNIARQSERAEQTRAHAARDAESFEQFLAQAGSAPSVIPAAANERGVLFKGLHAADIARALSTEAGITLGADAIVLEEPLKTVGEHRITLRKGGRSGQVSVLITAK